MSQVDAAAIEDDPTMETGTVTPFPDQSARQDAARTGILVFTRDPALIDTVRKAAPRDATVIHAPDLDQASDHLPGSQPDVLILDAACTSDIPTMAGQLTRQFPDLVTIVAGRREESVNLMKLTASGQVFRFLLVPLALGQTRLTLEAALRRHVERAIETAQSPPLPAPPSPPEESGGKRNLLFAGIGAALLLIVAGWFLMRGSETEVAPAGPEPVNVTDPSPPAVPAPVQAQLSLAASALEQEQYVEPAGTSALDHFRAALALEPTNGEALAGIRTIADRMVERAEAALLEERLDQAVAALELARNILPDHPRLTFLDAQVQRERERLQLTQARDVSVRLRGILNVASQRMAAGNFLTPSGESARDALNDARRLDATDPAVIQAFRDLSSRLLDEAERAVAAGQRAQAATLIAGARELSPSDARVAALERSLTEPAPTPAPRATQAPALSASALARTRLAEGRLIDPSGDSARDHLLSARTADPNDAEAQRLLLELKGRLVDSGRQALGAQDLDNADRFLKAASDLGIRGSDDTLATVQRDLERQRAERDFRNNIVSAGSLTRTRTVSPDYPESARRRGTEGWVDVNFTVTTNGTVEDVTVIGSNPVDVFDAAAIAAVRNWRFEPVVRGGTNVPQRAATRIRFDIEN